MHKYSKTIIAFSLLIQIICMKWIANFPDVVETYYSTGLYQLISKLMRFTFGWVPFSVGDILYTIASFYSIRWIIVNRKRIIKDTKRWIIDVIAAISMAYFAFHILWAFNYYRLPLHKTLHIENEYTTETLIATAEQLIVKVNKVHYAISKNDTLKVEIPYTKRELLKLTPNGYKALSKKFPHLAYQTRSLKRSIYSLPLTYMGFSGYLNPFTNEAQIDGLIPTFKYPTTASHEIAHQLGYAAENEANFIGAMAAIHHDDIYFKYSGYTFALRHCLFEIYKRDPERYELLVSKVNKGVLKNYKDVQAFWNSYQNPAEPLFKFTYNNFLKANNQANGMDSYSYVVALLVNYFEKNPI
jgi:hypothetical protein